MNSTAESSIQTPEPSSASMTIPPVRKQKTGSSSLCGSQSGLEAFFQSPQLLLSGSQTTSESRRKSQHQADTSVKNFSASVSVSKGGLLLPNGADAGWNGDVGETNLLTRISSGLSSGTPEANGLGPRSDEDAILVGPFNGNSVRPESGTVSHTCPSGTSSLKNCATNIINLNPNSHKWLHLGSSTTKPGALGPTYLDMESTDYRDRLAMKEEHEAIKARISTDSKQASTKSGEIASGSQLPRFQTAPISAGNETFSGQEVYLELSNLSGSCSQQSLGGPSDWSEQEDRLSSGFFRFALSATGTGGCSSGGDGVGCSKDDTDDSLLGFLGSSASSLSHTGICQPPSQPRQPRQLDMLRDENISNLDAGDTTLETVQNRLADSTISSICPHSPNPQSDTDSGHPEVCYPASFCSDHDNHYLFESISPSLQPCTSLGSSQPASICPTSAHLFDVKSSVFFSSLSSSSAVVVPVSGIDSVEVGRFTITRSVTELLTPSASASSTSASAASSSGSAMSPSAGCWVDPHTCPLDSDVQTTNSDQETGDSYSNSTPYTLLSGGHSDRRPDELRIALMNPMDSGAVSMSEQPTTAQTLTPTSLRGTGKRQRYLSDGPARLTELCLSPQCRALDQLASTGLWPSDAHVPRRLPVAMRPDPSLISADAPRRRSIGLRPVRRRRHCTDAGVGCWPAGLLPVSSGSLSPNRSVDDADILTTGSSVADGSVTSVKSTMLPVASAPAFGLSMDSVCTGWALGMMHHGAPVEQWLIEQAELASKRAASGAAKAAAAAAAILTLKKAGGSTRGKTMDIAPCLAPCRPEISKPKSEPEAELFIPPKAYISRVMSKSFDYAGTEEEAREDGEDEDEKDDRQEQEEKWDERHLMDVVNSSGTGKPIEDETEFFTMSNPRESVVQEAGVYKLIDSLVRLNLNFLPFPLLPIYQLRIFPNIRPFNVFLCHSELFHFSIL
ncbi:unnamed protein product [Protopolystoma xenopodis]|uniref:Uncharacterized protein n=1 Tax=Protopolystoma xenopodis TaxID=117903 RepID=A0A3S5C5Y4_9PLAT|nr:unnamed protein product [Protopolystoma xenopodis]